ncbi:ABC transporter substrate-binding protein [Spiractinospora alimapuensis]|uniref:ABC transporter substrate-binding protein n=1 Tax=Spiractinospora alimapuensis TaxID=2820884 RepID=UPI001F44050F|nr:ABC transporter substrate-binding protein [Spiractinospora alimapuensis]QVQ51695.1 ABC transporter substrate-binding protein [Spiractinospora alimapuensis]
MRRLKRSLLLPAAAAMALAMAAAGCAQSDRDGGGDASERNESDPFIFAGASNPRSMDPIYASDGETFRVSRQTTEALLRHEPGGTELEGALAEDWEHNEEGTEWTFFLRDGVTFHDGDEFNADAVCANYERWNETTGMAQSSSVMYYWNVLFDGFAENEDDDMPDSNFVGCEAEDDLTVTIEIEEYSARYPGAFSMAAMGLLSPSTIEQIPDDPVGGDSDDPSLPEYALDDTIAGTGPYELVDWDHGSEEVKLERFDDYWGDTANIREMIIKTIDDETARRQALEAGDIHGYDLVAPADVDPLADAGFNVPERDVFNVMYLAMVGDERIEDDHPDRLEEAEALADKDVRTAIAHAVDRQRIVDTILPPGGEVATQFIPDTLSGFSSDVTTYDYDPDLAREMLEDAGYEEGDLELEFCWPTDTTRPYMPAPQDIFNVVSNDLEEVGITVNENGLIWDDYIPYTEDGACSLYLLGWTGDYNETYNFLGTWFAGYKSAWRFEDDDVFDTLDAVNAEPDDEARIELYEEANEAIMDYLPGLPLSSSPPSIAFAEDIDPPTVSPLTQEDFAETSWAE